MPKEHKLGIIIGVSSGRERSADQTGGKNMILATSSASGSGSMVMMIVWLAVMFAIMYFLMVRPQKKEQKRLSAMINSMEVGDAVVTTSGFYGIVIDITEEDVVVEFGNNRNCRIPMKKAAITQVEKQEKAE